MKWTEALVLDALRSAYVVTEDARVTRAVMDEWAVLDHVPLRMPDGTNERIIDALAVRCWSGGKGFQRIAFEIKVSRSDFRNETDLKRAPAEASAHLCAYAAPAGLLRPDEMPPGWGLVEVYESPTDRPLVGDRLGSRGVWAKKPTKRAPSCDLDYLVTAGFRRASRAEQSIREGDVPAAEVALMRAEVERLTGVADRAKQAVVRETERAKAARSELLALAGDQECADCGGKLQWKRGGANDSTWSHVDRGQDGRCYEVRAEIDRKRREATYGAKYGWGFAAPVEPKTLREIREANQAVEAAS